MSKKWKLKRSNFDGGEELARELRISPVTAVLLLNRNFSSPQKAARFLEPSLHELRDPCRDPSVREAVRLTREHISAGHRITIYGDYDADGICACALLMRALKACGASVDFYIPHRFNEGYGLNREALDEIKAAGSQLVITVDCGVTAFKEARHARGNGLDIVVTDHHQPRGQVAEAACVLNPKLPDAEFGYGELAGVGVAFKLAWALGQEFGDEGLVPERYRKTLVDLLALVAIGSIADIVPLIDENRVLTHYGLKVLPQTSIPGLKALLEVSGMADKASINTFNVGYQLAPRLNAVGRMADARSAVEMLITEDEKRALEIAKSLHEHNIKRRSIQRLVTEEANQLVEATRAPDDMDCIVVSHPGWHPGVIGLAASRLADYFWRPAFVFREEEGMARGSARSIPGFHLFKAIAQCDHLLHRFGGHEGAAGLTLPMENLSQFKDQISEVFRKVFEGRPPIPFLELEGEIAFEQLSQNVVREFRLLEPFGEKNPKPLFMARNLQVVGNPQLVGSRRNHLSFMARQDDTTLRVIAFQKGKWLESFKSNGRQPFALAFAPQINSWRGRNQLELRAEDVQWQEEENIEIFS
jgi:single-stranded-DNA-specific exonuclease